MTLRVGCATPTDFWTASFDDKQAMMRRLADGGVDQVFICLLYTSPSPRDA